MANLKFEEALSRLEEAVKTLEKGDLPLEDSLKVFEEGIRLSKSCHKMLEEAEKKVEILIQDKEGKKSAHPIKIGSSAKDYDPQGVVGGGNANHGAPLEMKGIASSEETPRDPEGTSSHV